MPLRPGAPIIRTPDGFYKIGDAPYTKWVVTVVDGEKYYSLLVKQNIGDTPKELGNV